jgi:hypothetical protein
MEKTVYAQWLISLSNTIALEETSMVPLKREDHLGPDNSSGGMWDEESTIQLVFGW